jgi:acyl-CoA synthetase (AMP-forming)/AMP-acid ligase II
MSKGSVPAEIHGPEIPNIDRSLWSMLEDTAKAHPNSEAVVSLWQTSEHIIGDNPLLKAGDEVPLRWSYSQLLYHVETLATWLYTCGCRPGANMVVFAWNSAEWALFFWAAARLSMPFVPLDPLSLGKQDGGPLEETHSAVLVVPDEETARRFEERSILPPAQAIKIQIICSHTVGLPSWVSLYSVFTRSAAITESIELPPARTSPKGGHGKDVALIVFTSGTTNLPKGCVHSSANLWSETHVYDPSLRLQPGHRSLIHTPVSSISGINHVLRAWRGGASVVFPSRIFDPTATVNALSVERCTHVAFFPPMIQALAAVLALQSKTRPNLEFVTLIGQTISQDDIEKCKDVLRCKKAMQAYGLSEGAPVCSWSQDDPLLIQGYHEGVGKVLPGARVKICNPGERDSLRRGEPGELHVGGTSIVSGYLGGRHASSFYGDAEMTWFRTGDQAVMDEKDVIHIVGRYKDIIIRLGQNLAPARIEACIESFSGVKVSVLAVGKFFKTVLKFYRQMSSASQIPMLEKFRWLYFS